MKTIIAILVALMMTLIYGMAYAADAASEAETFNGITYSETGPTPNCSYVIFSGAGGFGGYAVEEIEVPANGISLFELSVPGTGANGLCAGHIGVEDLSEMTPNGITVMNPAM